MMVNQDKMFLEAVQFAEGCLYASQKMLERGMSVLPCLLVVQENGQGTIYGLAGEMDSDQRAMVIKELVMKDNGVMYVFHGDTWLRMPNEERTKVGEALTSTVVAKWGQQLLLVQSYTRDPFEFKEVQRMEHMLLTAQVWPEKMN